MRDSEINANFSLVPMAPRRTTWMTPAPVRPKRVHQSRFAAALARVLARLLGL